MLRDPPILTHSGHPCNNTCKKGSLSTAQSPIKEGAYRNAYDATGRTSLHIAFRHGHLFVVFVLVESGAYINSADNDERTALHFVCSNGHVAFA